MQGGGGELDDLGAPGGTPMAIWVKLFFLTYSVTKIGLLFNAWPDGRAAEDQPQLLLDVFGVMRDEAVQIMNEAAQEK
jgi:hypothetical protein